VVSHHHKATTTEIARCGIDNREGKLHCHCCINRIATRF
jgi:hypothetical protein